MKFLTDNNHLLHRNAVRLTIEQLDGAVDVDSVAGKKAKYDIDWNGRKIRVKMSRRTKKSSFKKPRWYYSIKKEEHRADYFVLYALKENEIGAVYVLPSIISPKRFITISTLNGNSRYEYFKTTPQELAKKIMKVENELPRLVKIYKDARNLDTMREEE